MAGRLKVFLGMAAGVGKTYRMLQEGEAELVAGRDVVIGYLEPHDRPETSEQARGLEVVPDEDARAQPFRLTAQGKRLIEKAVPAWEEAQRQATELLGDEGIALLDKAAKKLRAAKGES